MRSGQETPVSSSTAAAMVGLNVDAAMLGQAEQKNASLPEQDLIKSVIEKAVKKFIEGSENNKAFKEQIKKDPALKQKIRYLETAYPQYKDDHFLLQDANKISGTHFVASSGPRYRQDVAKFLRSTVLNEQFPIKEIIALGDTLAGKGCGFTYYDFYDYGSGEQKEAIFTAYENNDVSECKGEKLFDVKVEAKRTLGTVGKDRTGKIYPKGIVQSQLDVTLLNAKDGQHTLKKRINVTLYSLLEGDTIELSEERRFANTFTPLDERKEILWQLFLKSLNETVLIHCGAGRGRTGHLILTFELLKYYKEIFASQDSDIIAAEILKIVDRIRENRPALIFIAGQFEGAIENASILYHFALGKKYIQAGESFQNTSKEVYEEQSPRNCCALM